MLPPVSTLSALHDRLHTAHDFDILLIDLLFGPNSALPHLRRFIEEYPGLKVLVLSGYVSLAVAQQCIRAGARGIVPKLYASDELLEAIREVHAGRTFISPNIGSAHEVATPELAKLGDRTIRILGYLRRGLSYRAIAALEGISVKAVEYHERQLRKALGMPKGRGGWDLV